MSKNLKVLVSSNEFPESALNILKENFTVVQCKQKNDYKSHNVEELNQLIQGCSALVWLNDLFITPEMLDRAGPQLKLVATVSAGYNHCLPEELRSRGIKLSNTPNVLSAAVSEIAVGLMIAASRRFTESLLGVRSGNWASGFDVMLGQDIRGSTVGVVGLGGIGQALVRRLAGFEVGKVVYSGHREKPEGKALNATFVTQDELLAQSDYVVLCVPLSTETQHLLNAAAIAKMKANAIVINVGRGDLIDQEALYDALKSGRIWAAGLDVTSPEPLPGDHKLLALPNCFVTPHIGSATRRTRSDMAELAANNVVSGLGGRPLITPVIE